MTKDNSTQVQTTRMGNFDMASAANRIKKFREDHIKGKISTKHEKDENGYLVFKSYVWKDKSELMDILKSGASYDNALGSADSDASARGETKTKKDFEKLETIATGRALAYLGYLANGQVASSEEMEQFHEYKEKQLEEAIVTAIEHLEESISAEDLRKRWTEIGGDMRKVSEVGEAKDKIKEKFSQKVS